MTIKNDIKIYAAPLQGYTEMAWRNAHEKVFGVIDAYYTPFIRLEKGGIRNKDKREIDIHNNTVGQLVPQIIASGADEFRTLAQYVHTKGYHEIDFNMGCPFPMMANHGKGSGLLPYPDKVKEILNVMNEMPEVRFSVKMRLGWKEANEWESILPLLNESCISQIVLHPRTGKQQYKGEIDRKRFREFYDECKKPLIYNGDLCTADDVEEITDAYPHLNGVMLGRGLLANPALATEIREGKCLPPNELYTKVAEMHHAIYLQYMQTIEGGEAQLVSKLKVMWEYLLPGMDKKHRKQIKKSNKLDVYLRAVNEALSVSF